MITSTAKPLTRTIVAPLRRDQYRLFRESSRTGDEAAAWRALEWEHILNQPYMGAHLASHWHMFRYAIELGDSREAAGQVVRFLLVPLGSLTGRPPAGTQIGRAACRERVSQYVSLSVVPASSKHKTN